METAWLFWASLTVKLEEQLCTFRTSMWAKSRRLVVPFKVLWTELTASVSTLEAELRRTEVPRRSASCW